MDELTPFTATQAAQMERRTTSGLTTQLLNEMYRRILGEVTITPPTWITPFSSWDDVPDFPPIQPTTPMHRTYPIPLPEGIPAVPEGMIYLGTGGDQFGDTRCDAIKFPGDPVWNIVGGLSMSRGDCHLACRRDNDAAMEAVFGATWINLDAAATIPIPPGVSVISTEQIRQAYRARPLPADAPPMPRGFVYLGTGSIDNVNSPMTRRFRAWGRIGASWMEANTSGSNSRYHYCVNLRFLLETLDNYPGFCEQMPDAVRYGAPITSETPHPANHTMSLPPGVGPLPTNTIYLGLGNAANRSSHLFNRWYPADRLWRPFFGAANDPQTHYASRGDHAANARRESRFTIPAGVTVTAGGLAATTPVTAAWVSTLPIPGHIPAIPDGWVYAGVGASDDEITEHFVFRIFEDEDDVENDWSEAESMDFVGDNYHFLIRPQDVQAFIAAYPMVATRFAHPVPAAPPAPQMQPTPSPAAPPIGTPMASVLNRAQEPPQLPEDCPSLPEGFTYIGTGLSEAGGAVIMGGDSIACLNNGRMREWDDVSPHGYSFFLNDVHYAVRAERLEEFLEAKPCFRPRFTSAPQPPTPLPAGWVYVGTGIPLTATEREDWRLRMALFDTDGNRWMVGDYSGHDYNAHYAVETSRLAELHRISRHFREGNFATPACAPKPPPGPKLPDGYVYLGPGSERNYGNVFRGLFWPEEGDAWIECVIQGIAETSHYACLAADEAAIRGAFPAWTIPDQVIAGIVPPAYTPPTMHHLLTYNGVPIEDLEDLKSAIAGDLLDPSTLAELTAKLHTARYEELPEGFIELWTEREPVVMGLIEFRPAPAPASVMPMLPAPTSTLAASVNRAAALGLLSGEIGDHFLFTEENNVIINPANPPTLEQAYEITRRALEIKEAGSRLDNFACWTLGAIVDQCERFFGDRFDITTVCEATAKSYNVVVTALGVFRAFGAQRRALSFTHHKEVYYADMPDEAKYWVLDQSEKLELTCAQNRDLVRYVRKHGIEDISADDLADTHRLMDKCKAQGRTKIWLFQLRGEWFEYRGSFEDIPNGADPIINGESRAPVDRQGRIVRPKEWALPGEPLRGNQAVKEAAVVKAREAAQAMEEPAEPEATIEVESTQVEAVVEETPPAEVVVSTQPEEMPEYLARAEPAELF